MRPRGSGESLCHEEPTAKSRACGSCGVRTAEVQEERAFLHLEMIVVRSRKRAPFLFPPWLCSPVFKSNTYTYFLFRVVGSMVVKADFRNRVPPKH